MSLLCHSYVIRMPFVYHSYVNGMSNVCTRMLLICHTDVIRMYSYVICILLVCTRKDVKEKLSNFLGIRILSVCTRMSSVCHSYVLVCHLYVTRIYSYVIRVTLVCGFTVNLYYV